MSNPQIVVIDSKKEKTTLIKDMLETHLQSDTNKGKILIVDDADFPLSQKDQTMKNYFTQSRNHNILTISTFQKMEPVEISDNMPRQTKRLYERYNQKVEEYNKKVDRSNNT